ncbi:MAG: glycosyltransferase [Lachnospiraceae bacterium]|nr:glycosyltransferase [Lachnospiraceae bacterium]
MNNQDRILQVNVERGGGKITDLEQREILQVNLDGSGGAFALVYEIQKKIWKNYGNQMIFSYYCMGEFANGETADDIERMGGHIEEGKLRKNRWFGHILLPFYFYKYCKSTKAAIVHIHGDTAFKLFIYAYPAKLAGKYVLVHSHSSGINGKAKHIKMLLHLLCKPLLPLAVDGYLTCSQKATKWMYYKPTQSKVVWLKNGVDTKRFCFNEEERRVQRQRLNLGKDDYAIVVVGDLSIPKNPYFICDVMKKLCVTKSHIRLFFCGDGAEREGVEKYVERLELGNKVVFLGKQRMDRVLNGMDLFVMPSRFEGLPISGIEAQANGLTCIFSDRIAKDVAIIPQTYFTSIDSVDAWCETIEKVMLLDIDRALIYKLVNDAGFDIEASAKNLFKYYESLGD